MGRKLLLNMTGSGLGGVLVNIARDKSLLNIYVDGWRKSFVKEEFMEYSIARIPIIYSSNHIVEIEFGE